MAPTVGNSVTLEGAVSGLIGNIKEVSSGGGLDRESLDVTELDGTASFYKTFMGGMVDGGSLTLTLHYLKTTCSDLMDLIVAANEAWTMTLSDGSTIINDGFVTNVGLPQIDGTEMRQDITIKWSGEPAFTAGT